LSFPKITATTKSLSVGTRIFPSIKDGDNVIHLKVLFGLAVRTLIIRPVLSLVGSKLFSVSPEFRWFMKSMVFPTGASGHHHVIALRPKTLAGSSDLFLRFVSVFVAFGILVSSQLAFSLPRDGVSDSFSVRSIPERVSLSTEVNGQTGLGTGFSGSKFDLAWSPIELLFADDAVEGFSSFLHSYGSKANWVNSGEESILTSEYDLILSQAETGMFQKVQRSGDEARTASNSPTNAQLERGDLIRTIRRLIDPEGKLFRGNKIDDIIDTSPQDTATMSNTPWKFYAGSVSISEDERLKNMGEHAFFNLLSHKTQVGIESVRDKLVTDIYTDATADPTKAITPMSLIMDNDATTTVGGISGSTNTWWQNYNADVTAFGTNLYNDMLTAYNTQSRGAVDFPDTYIFSLTGFEYFERFLTGITGTSGFRLPINNNSVADVGFETMKFKNADVFFDPAIASGMPEDGDTAFVVNTKYLHYYIHPQAEFTLGEFIKPTDQHARVALINHMCSLVTDARWKLGLLYGINAS